MTNISYPGFKEAEGKTTAEIRENVRKMAKDAKMPCPHRTLQCRWDTSSGRPFGPTLGGADRHTIYCTSCAEVLLIWIAGKGVLEAVPVKTRPIPGPYAASDGSTHTKTRPKSEASH